MAAVCGDGLDVLQGQNPGSREAATALLVYLGSHRLGHSHLSGRHRTTISSFIQFLATRPASNKLEHANGVAIVHPTNDEHYARKGRWVRFCL